MTLPCHIAQVRNIPKQNSEFLMSPTISTQRTLFTKTATKHRNLLIFPTGYGSFSCCRRQELATQTLQKFLFCRNPHSCCFVAVFSVWWKLTFRTATTFCCSNTVSYTSSQQTSQKIAKACNRFYLPTFQFLVTSKMCLFNTFTVGK